MNDAAARTQHGRRTRVWRAALAITALLLIILLLAFDWDWLQGPVERRVSRATGRQFVIDGHLDVDVGSTLVINAIRLTLANAAWSKRGSPEEPAHLSRWRM